MTERHLFRGKEDRPDGEFIVGYLCGENAIAWSEYDLNGAHDYMAFVIPDTIGQCTGLRDKDGTLIFEGDIVKAYGRLCFVRFRAGCWELRSIDGKLIRYGTSEMLGDCNDEHLKVIGNIHDNPELMEGST